MSRPAGPSVVIDLGSHSIKAGFGNIEYGAGWAPDIVMPTATLPTEGRATMLGDNAWSKFDRRDEIIMPIRCGKIVDHAQLELLLHHIVANTLEANEGKHSIVFADAPGHGAGCAKDREFLMQLAFDKWKMQRCVFYSQPVLAAFAAGKTTALVCDLGYESSSVSVVNEGRMEQSKVLRVNYPASSSAMLDLLLEKDRGDLQDLGPAAEKICQDTCYVCSDVNKEIAKAKSGRTKKRYRLPDGQWITVSEERFLVPEILFSSSFGNRWKSDYAGGIPGAVSLTLHQSLAVEQSRSVPCYTDLAQNLVAVGGRSDVEGFDERFDAELRRLLGIKGKKKVHAQEAGEMEYSEEEMEDNNADDPGLIEPHDLVPKPRSRRNPRRFATWAGGAMIANLSAMREMWTTKRQYEELGADLAVDGRRF